jgi:outer membrane cobalamin receptor
MLDKTTRGGKMKKIFIMVLVSQLMSLLLVQTVIAGDFGQLKGRVVDKETGEQLASVNVIIKRTIKKAVTGPNGIYSINNILPGRYKVVVTKAGYNSICSEITISPGKVSVLDFQLSSTAIFGGEYTIVVTATKTEHTLGDVPVAVEVITKQEINDMNVKNVQDVLSYLPGLQVTRSSGSWGNKGNVQIHGLGTEHTLILVDGQKYHGGHGGTDIHSIPVNMIEKIEVVKGAASALYGSDAIGGVINIITKSALASQPNFSISGGYGSLNTQVYETNGRFSKGKFGSSLNLTRRQSDGISRDIDEYEESIAQGSLEYEFSPGTKISLNPYYSELKMKDKDRTQKRLVLNSRFEWKPDELSKLNLRGSIFNYKHYTLDKKSNWEGNNYEFELNYSRVIFNKHILIGGYHLQMENIDDEGKGYEGDQTIHSFFIQDESEFGPLTVVLGTRVDLHDRWGTEANPKLSLMYSITNNFKLRASFGEAFRSPPLVRLYGDNWKMGPYLVKANPDLKPEKSLGYQIGTEIRFSGHVMAGISFFRNDVEDLISYRIERRGRPPWSMYWENVDKAVTQGVEVNLTTRIVKNLTGKVGYTLLDTEDKSTGNELVYRPKHTIKAMINWKIPCISFNINLSGQYIGKRFGDDENTETYDPYTIINLSLTKDITRYAKLFVRIGNIFNRENVPDEYDINGTQFFGGFEFRL